MKIGLQLPNFTLGDGPQALRQHLKEMAQRAESCGFSSLWVMDHFFQIPHLGRADKDMLEAYTTLGFLAACTENLELGTMVTGVTYRQPGLLGKLITTLDVLSGGRAWLGIGAAWFEREHRALGFPYPSLKERFERLEETLQIVRQMWSTNNGPFQGKHYQLQETLCSPQALRQPPIMIGGMGEEKTLRLVAQYGQACNLFEHAGLKTLEHKLQVLKRHCENLGTDYGKLSKTVLGQTSLSNQKSAEKLLAKLEQLSALGFDHAVYAIKNPEDTQSLRMFEQHIIPQARQFAEV